MREAARTGRAICLLALAAALAVAAFARAQPSAETAPASANGTSPAPRPGPPPAARPGSPRSGPPTSQPEATYPAAWHVVKRFDFDEARLGNDSDLPMYWYRFKGKDYPDFPRYAVGVWDRSFGYRGNESFRLELNGGNVGYYYQTNSVTIAPGQDVRVEAMVRTTGLVHARAMLEVSLNDARGEVVPGSQRRSPLLGGPGQDDRWMKVAVLVPGKFPSARYVNVSVFLLQPKRWRALDPSAGNQPALIDYIDVHSKAWFDDITIFRLPRVTLTTDQPGQLLPSDQAASLHLAVEGFANQPLEAELAVRDAVGRLIGHELFTSPGTERSSVRTFRWQGPKLPAGLYRAELGLYAGGARLAGLPPLLIRQLTFAQLPAATGRAGGGRGFGLVLDAPPAGLEGAAARDLADEQADALARLPVGLVKLPLWRSGQQLNQIEQGDPWTDQLIRRLVRQRIGLVAVFGQIPAPLQAGQTAVSGAPDLGLRRTLLDVFCDDPALWRPFVASQLARYAEQIRYWQIGQEDAPYFAVDPRFLRTLDEVRKEFRTLLTAPTFVVTWPALYAYRHGGPEGAGGSGSAGGPPVAPFPAEIANLFCSNRLTPNSLPDYTAEFVGLTAVRPWVTVERLGEQQYRREARMEDLAWRLVQASCGTATPLPPAATGGPATPGQVFISAPWTVREAGGAELLEPTEELLIFRTAADLLGGCRYGGHLQLADGVVAHIFDRGDGTGVMAVRNVASSPATPIELHLGEQVARVDLWGNREPVSVDGEGRQLINAARLPFYLDGIDPRLARLRASFAMDPGFVPSSYKKHLRQVQFINGFDTPVSGRLTLHFPANWEVHPRVIPFSAQAGERFTRQIEIRFPYNAEAGVKEMVGDLALDADRAYRIQLASRFEFGLADVDVRTLTQWLAGDELLVTLNVTNRSEGRLDLFCFVVAPDRPRQERVIAGLPPGGAAIKGFRIPDARGLVGQSLRVGLREVRGSRIVNYDVPVQ